MAESMKYPPQGTSKNKQRLQEFLEKKKGIALDTVTVTYMPNFSQHHGDIDYNNPKTVSLDDLPDDIQECTVLVEGQIRWEVKIGSSELTAE